jgi:hypothetical protein
MKLSTIVVFIIFCGTLIANAGVSLDKSIVVYYSFNDGKAKDESGNGNDGVITSAKAVEGIYGKGLNFDGESWVEVKPNKSLDVAEITMAAWIYKDKIYTENQGENIISKKQGGAYTISIGGWENHGGCGESLETEMRISGSYHYVCEKKPLPLKEWVHVASTYDGKDMKIFLNGKEVGSKSCKGKIDFNGANFYVGAESDGGQPDDDHGRFVGRIDEVYVANRAFSEKEIQELMTSALPVELKTKLPVIWSQLKSN